jgi:hypothetical protein
VDSGAARPLACGRQQSLAAPKVRLCSLLLEERPRFRELCVRLRLAPRAGSFLMRNRSAEERDNRVADELIDRAAVSLELVAKPGVMRSV